MKRLILAASDDLETQFSDSLKTLNDDFDYIISGLEMLSRSGNFSTAQDIVSQISSSLTSFIEDIANNVGSDVEASSYVTSGWMSKLKEKGLNLEDMLAEYREETGTDPVHDEAAKKRFRKWAEQQVNSCDSNIYSSTKLNDDLVIL